MTMGPGLAVLAEIVNYRWALKRANLGGNYFHYYADLVLELQCCSYSSVLSACLCGWRHLFNDRDRSAPRFEQCLKTGDGATSHVDRHYSWTSPASISNIWMRRRSFLNLQIGGLVQRSIFQQWLSVFTRKFVERSLSARYQNLKQSWYYHCRCSSFSSHLLCRDWFHEPIGLAHLFD